MVIVGTFLPQIEIWDLNKEDCEPVFTLGGIDDPNTGKKGKSKMINQFNKNASAKLVSEDSHQDAVMSLSLNPF